MLSTLFHYTTGPRPMLLSFDSTDELCIRDFSVKHHIICVLEYQTQPSLQEKKINLGWKIPSSVWEGNWDRKNSIQKMDIITTLRQEIGTEIPSL